MKRLPDGTPFDPDAGLRWHTAQARTRRRPLELPALRALAFGDRIVGVEGGLRYWIAEPEPTDERAACFRRVDRPAAGPPARDRLRPRARHPRRARHEGRAPRARGRTGRRALVSPPVMSDHVYKSVEITGSSPEGIQQAIDNALAKARETLRNLDWFEVSGHPRRLRRRRAPLPGHAQDRLPARIAERRPGGRLPTRADDQRDPDEART